MELPTAMRVDLSSALAVRRRMAMQYHGHAIIMIRLVSNIDEKFERVLLKFYELRTQKKG